MTDAGSTPFPAPERGGRPLRALLLLSAIFVVGAVFGGAGSLLAFRHALSNPPSGGWANRKILTAMSRDLKLDDTQKARVGRILGETRAELLEVADRVEPEVRSILEKGRERIRAELRGDQIPKFDIEVGKRTKQFEGLRRRFRG